MILITVSIERPINKRTTKKGKEKHGTARRELLVDMDNKPADVY